MSRRKTSRSDQIYRFLMRLFPFDFRREFGSDMEYVFRHERKHAQQGGLRSGIRLWWRTLAGFLTTAPLEHLDVLRQDIHFGMRSLRKKPAFTFVAIVALTIGIGANIAIFGLANALLLKPLPVADPNRVIRVFANRFSNMSYADYREYRDRNHSISDLSAFQGAGVSLRIAESPESAQAFAVTGNYFTGMGVTAALGRMIGPIDDQPGAPGAVVLSHIFWKRRLGADPGIIGRTLTINRDVFTIVGVAPEPFTGTMPLVSPALWLPWNKLMRAKSLDALIMGRLRPGVSHSQAQADLSAIAAQLSVERGQPVRVAAYPARSLPPEFATAATGFSAFLMALVGLVLIIACLNIATMLLARTVERRREMGIRIALGAGRSQLIRQLLTEGLLLSVAGGGAAAVMGLLAAQTVPLSISGLPADAVALDLQFDWRVGLFAAAISLATTFLFALVPAVQGAGTAVMPALKDGALTTAPVRSRLRAGFVVAQVAMSTLLLVIGALLVRTLTNPQTANRGFDAAGVLTAGFDLDSAGYTPDLGREFQERLLQQLEGTPGVISANILKILPLTLSNDQYVFQRDGIRVVVNTNLVSRGHFRTLGIPFVEGRDFNTADRYGGPAAGIINERLARWLWPHESPIGKRFEDVEIVGVVGDSKYISVTEDPKYFLYRSLSQSWVPNGTLLVKTQGDPMNVLPAVRATVRSLDPDLPLSNFNSMEKATSISLLPLRIAAALASALGLVALALGASGIYGVVSYLVRQRTREIGIRMALGAGQGGLVRLVTRQAMVWTVSGLAIGLLAAFAAGQLLRDLIYGISPADPVAFISIPIVLAGTAYAACWFPARRASRIDPLLALREE